MRTDRQPPPIIDHNRYELPNDTTPWKLIFGVIAVLWIGALWRLSLDWTSVMIGLGTGVMIASYAIVKTGGKVPESWRTKPPRR